jgi:GDPmannose 4,6-dehydratase
MAPRATQRSPAWMLSSRSEFATKVKLHSMSPADFQSVAQVDEGVAPDEIYNLSGQSSVSLSFHPTR